MFVDTARVFVSAGKGGDGAVSFRHEIYVEKGGPDGGDGGRGGDVVVVASYDSNTLVDFRYKPELKAKLGGNGAKRNKHGANGESLLVKVPVGTIIKKDGQTIIDLVEEGQKFVVAMGGDGGFGNAHFKSSVRQTPRVAEKGETGESFELELELKLLADVGLVGFPNAGKSTFLSVVSNARPEIADYAFTTLTPNLGVSYVDNTSLLIADIPGLIEGASEGKGLGDAFLRHIERTSVLLHLIDAYTEDVIKSYKTIRRELSEYNQDLLSRPEIVALTKIDGLDEEIVEMQINSLSSVVEPTTKIFTISSVAKKGLTELLQELSDVVSKTKVEKNDLIEDDDEVATISLSQEKRTDSWTVKKELNDKGEEIFVVRGDKIEKFARRTNFDNFEGVNRLRDIMKKMGISHELRRQGADGSSVLRIGSSTFTFQEQ